MSVFFAVEGVGIERRAAFYLSQSSAPAGAVRITAARHAELLTAQAQGRKIVADARGRPVIEPAQRPLAAVIRSQLHGKIRREAARRIQQVSPEWRQLNDLREPSEAGAIRFSKIDAIRSASDAIGELADRLPAADLDGFPVADHTLWPEFD